MDRMAPAKVEAMKHTWQRESNDTKHKHGGNIQANGECERT